MASEHATPSVATKVSRGAVDRAVAALLKWHRAHRHDDDEPLYLVISLKKIPHRGRPTAEDSRTPLPHPVASSACLVVDDRPKSPSVSPSAARDLIRGLSLPLPVDVLSLSELRADRRGLANSHDLFVADRRLAPLLPRLLGQKKKSGDKVPVLINLGRPTWPEYLQQACASTSFRLGSGTCSVVKVGRMSQGKCAIAENVLAAAEGVVKVVPKKWKNVRALHLKTSESLALPVYPVLDSGVEDEERFLTRKRNGVAEEISDNQDLNVGKRRRF